MQFSESLWRKCKCRTNTGNTASCLEEKNWWWTQRSPSEPQVKINCKSTLTLSHSDRKCSQSLQIYRLLSRNTHTVKSVLRAVHLWPPSALKNLFHSTPFWHNSNQKLSKSCTQGWFSVGICFTSHWALALDQYLSFTPTTFIPPT